MRNNPFSSYRPGVAALGGGNFAADSKPKTSVDMRPKPTGQYGGGSSSTDPMDPGGWVPEPGSGGPKPITNAAGGQPWDSNRTRSWWDKMRNSPMTTYGRNNTTQQQGAYTVAGQRGVGSGGQMYDPAQYGSNYTGPRASINNLPPELIGNPNIWNQEWMGRYNDFLRGVGPDPRTQAQLATIPGSGMGPPAPGGG